MATIRFFIRTETKKENVLVPVYVRVRAGHKIDMVAKADIFINPDNWSNEKEQARQKADVFKHLAGVSGIPDQDKAETGRQNFNNQITALREYIESKLMDSRIDEITEGSRGHLPEGAERKKDVSKWLSAVMNRHWHPEKYEENLFSYIQKFIDHSETRLNTKTGRPVCYKMRREYEVTFNYLKRYSQKIGKSIDFKDIDQSFYDDFINFLQKEKLATNTIGKKIQTLKIFLNSAKEENKNHYEAFKSKKFVAISEEADTIALSEAELNKLYEHDFSKSPSHERVRDLFLVAAWTGCRFSDLRQITPDVISGGFIRIKQQKTDKRVVIPLHPVVTEILNKYKGTLPEIITNQKFNLALKTIGEEAELSDITSKSITRGGVKVSKAYKKYELMTSHTARRSFATNLYNSGNDSLSIMKITGHKTEKAFLKYIKINEEDNARKVQRHWNKRYLKLKKVS